MTSSAPVLARYQDVSEAKAGGATYTPQLLSDFVAGQILAVANLGASRPLRVLDPAIGHGELLVSLLSRLEGNVEVFGYETDPAALQVARERLTGLFPDATLNLSLGSFLDHVLDDHSGGPFPTGERYDLIIANPPYVRTQIIGADKAQRLAEQFGLTGRVDLYFAFLLGMARVLREGGTCGIIVSNRFMTTKSGATVREALARKLDLKRIFDLGDTKLFDAAVLPAVIIANGPMAGSATSEAPRFTTIYEAKGKAPLATAENAIAALGLSGAVGLSDGRVFDVQHGMLQTTADGSDVWRLGSAGVTAWLDAVEAKAWACFRDIGKVRVGVKTTADKIFIRREWKDELELLRPLTTHKIARRFRADVRSEKIRILYPHDTVDGRRTAVDLEKYPASRAYLEEHREKLEGRTYVIEGGRKWYEIWVPQNPSDWSGPKLVFRDISERPTFWIDVDDTIVNGDCYWLKPRQGMEGVLWLVLAVANSTFIERFYDTRFNNKLYAGRRRFITQYVDAFPVPDPNTDIGQEIIEKTRRLFDRVGEDDAPALERELDGLVWRAFGLLPEEI
ncbi:Eco57I restriction-modification methylase domain-containing protein [Sphingosinicella microcystinivorans]|uniref:Eco57I restriction-modification methylase domain-containing protein n=1 Tax=Sphingosinicella microcystinivorans TaxID=335406 RepID=UPI0022F407D0|nr:N-6 DNA methylase [Sphingosinicella microcystinivorans]WBX85592.1 N-6 DNA methylase [Sphingosinicella microcystinivorans]